MMKPLIAFMACLFLPTRIVTAEAAAPAWQTLPFDGQFSAWKQPSGAWFTTDTTALDAEKNRFLQENKGKGGIAVNGPEGKTSDLISTAVYGDCEIHVEFMIARKSNSGIYVMGAYEVQIYDSSGVAKDQYPGIECGGIYPQWIANRNQNGHSPTVNAAKPFGEWQSFDIVFQAPRFDDSGKKSANAKFVKIIHNGKTIHENVEVSGPTRGGFEPEKTTGPLRLQGDHGPVAYRNVRIRPTTADTHTASAGEPANRNPFFPRHRSGHRLFQSLNAGRNSSAPQLFALSPPRLRCVASVLRQQGTFLMPDLEHRNP